MDEADKRRVRKAEMMEEFSGARKQHIITSVLAVFTGVIGGQRIYLNQHTIALIIFALFVVSVVAAMLGYPLVGIAFFAVFIFEVFYATNATDKWNNKLRRELEKKYEV